MTWLNNNLANVNNFKVINITPNYNSVNAGYMAKGIGFQIGNFVIFKFSFGGAFFDTEKPIAFIPSQQYYPISNTNCLIRCRRTTADGNGYNDYIDQGCYVDTSGRIWQTFNSDKTLALWVGDIFGCYKIN